ncbi:hypothetical protein QO058_20745 [Bosea vestrisii]|uniref:hypothetical protein n=1 Tax=Bosea vestrisii TaxID=151416 RepID=UPI0024DFC6F6|nr:hypothetical protein [Bosea vestrisii]WID95203.1 hypothetical protein QO058_20745 [Bosea vestrisii]
MIELTRRGLIGGAAATTLLAPCARAQATQVVVGTWGGDVGDLMREHVDLAIMKPQGFDVVQDISAPTTRRTRLLAERQNRRGSMDVAGLADFDMYAVAQQNTLEELNEQNLPRFAKVMPFLRKAYSIPFIYSAHTIVYNVDRVKTPPSR